MNKEHEAWLLQQLAELDAVKARLERAEKVLLPLALTAIDTHYFPATWDAIDDFLRASDQPAAAKP